MRNHRLGGNICRKQANSLKTLKTQYLEITKNKTKHEQLPHQRGYIE